MAQEGGCYCGNVRFSVEGEPVRKAVCHCIPCRKMAGSAYSVNLIYPTSQVKVIKGTLKDCKRIADSGNTVVSFFCGDCGTTLWSEPPSGEVKVVKAGTLDDVNALNDAKPAAELFVPYRPNWIPAIEGAHQLEAMP